MTKKATWSGYRGDGKPVIPCVPECSIEKDFAGNSGFVAKTPTDYKSRSRKLSSSPRKQIKRIRNELFTQQPKPSNMWADQHYFYGGLGRTRNNAVQKAFESGDLDLLLVYKDHWHGASLDAVHGTVLALRGMGHPSVHGVITEANIKTLTNVSNLISAFGSSHYLSLDPFKYVENTEYTSDSVQKIAMIALTGKAEEAAVIHVITEREITDPEDVGKLVREMLVDSYALSSGLL